MGGESPRVLWITNTHAESLQSDLIADLRGPATAKPRIVVLGSGESASVGKSHRITNLSNLKHLLLTGWSSMSFIKGLPANIRFEQMLKLLSKQGETHEIASSYF